MIRLVSLEDMERITRAFRKDIIQLDGSRVLKNKHMEYIEKTHFDIPNLEYNVLCEIPRLLIRTTIFPQGARYGNADQPPFYLWMAEVSSYLIKDIDFLDKRFIDLFWLLISSHLVDDSPLPSTTNFHLQRFIGNFHILAACYSFPFLERCIRTKCHNFVELDGLVIRDFSIPRFGRRDRLYTNGQFISNISDEVKLLYFYVASYEFKKTLYRFMIELNEDSWLRFPDPFELIGYWRNRLLHGEYIWSSGWDIATYLTCLILLNYITPYEYNSKLEELKEHIKYKQETSSPFLWYMYKI